MVENKRSLDSLLHGGKYCIKCGSNIPKDEIGHNCEIIECPNPTQEYHEHIKEDKARTKKLASQL